MCAEATDGGTLRPGPAGLAQRRNGWPTYAVRAAAFAGVVAVALACRTDYLGEWDSWDYASQAIRRHSSDLALGRWWFIAAMRAAHLVGCNLFGLDVLQSCLAMQWACALLTGAGLVVGMAWARRLTREPLVEPLLAVLIMVSPLVGVYGAAVMTESLAFVALMAALWAWERALSGERRRAAWAFAAGLAFGIAVNVREPLVLLGFWPILSCLAARRPGTWRLLPAAAGGAVVSLGVGVVGAWAWYPFSNGYWGRLGVWLGWMARRREEAGGPLSAVVPRNLACMRRFAEVSAPTVALLMGPALLWAAVWRRRLLLLAAAAGPYLAWLATNPDLPIGPRYLLPLVWLAAAVSAGALAWTTRRLGGAIARRLEAERAQNDRQQRARRRWVLATVTAGAVAVVAAVGARAALDKRAYYQTHHYCHARLRHRLFREARSLGRSATVALGEGTIGAQYLCRLGLKRFRIVPYGMTRLEGEALRRFLAEDLHHGRSVFVDLRRESWPGRLGPGGPRDQLARAIEPYPVRPGPGGFLEVLPASAGATASSAEGASPVAGSEAVSPYAKAAGLRARRGRDIAGIAAGR